MRPALVMLLSSVVLSASLPGQGIPSHPIKFEDIADRAGVHFVTQNSPTPEKHQPETMPAGIALFDYDGD